MAEPTEFQAMLVQSWIDAGMDPEEAKALFIDMYDFQRKEQDG